MKGDSSFLSAVPKREWSATAQITGNQLLTGVGATGFEIWHKTSENGAYLDGGRDAYSKGPDGVGKARPKAKLGGGNGAGYANQGQKVIEDTFIG